MSRYRLNLGTTMEFDAENPAECLGVWKKVYLVPDAEHEAWRRTAASVASAHSGKAIRYHSDDAFVWDMMEHGMLEQIS